MKSEGKMMHTTTTLQRSKHAAMGHYAGALALAMLLLPCHSAFAGGLGNTPPSVDSVTVSPTPVNAGLLASITCTASDSNGQVKALEVSVSAGTLVGGGTQASLTIAAGANVSGSIGWNAPAAGTYDITCTAFDDGGLFGGSAQTSKTVQVTVTQPVGSPPSIDSFTADKTSVLPGAQVALHAVVTDADGDSISLGWSSSGGQLVPAGADAVWTAPAGYGNYTVTLSADDGVGNTTTANLVISVSWAVVAPPIGSGIATPFYPERISRGPGGLLYVTDSRANNVAVFGVNGVRQRTIAVDGRVAGVAAASDGRLFVGDLLRRQVLILNGVDQVVGTLGAGPGEFTAPLDIDVAQATGYIYVADGEAGEVKVYAPTGAKVQTLAITGGMVSGVAVSATGDAVYATDSRNGKVHIFDAQGVQTGTLGSFGGTADQISRGAGLAVDAQGHVAVVDAYQSRVVIFKNGQPLDQLGRYGTAAGEMVVPLDVTFDQGGRIIVTNTQNGRLEVLTPAGSAAPVCANDADCDSMNDAWETANGLNPNDPSDAAGDADTDGLTNAQEFGYQTNPNKADTDDDGVADLVEIEQGKDPTDPSDQGLLAKAGADIDTAPAMVELDGTASRVDGATPQHWMWQQVDGPTQVSLAGADTARPSFAARAAGTYTFELKVGDGAEWSAGDSVQVQVQQVAPIADAGRNFTLKKGKWGLLDGLFSSDANGDQLSYAWQQVAGDDIEVQAPNSAQPIFKTQQTGVFAFDLTVTDASGLQSDPARVWVTVNSDVDHVPVAAGPAWSEGKLDALVELDGSASVDSDGEGLTYSWTQVAGPTVDLQAATSDKPVFLAFEAGLYAFELRVGDQKHVSPPHRMEVAVRAQPCGDACAKLDAGAEQRVVLGAEVELTCSAAAGVNCEWTQVEGVHVLLAGQGHKRTFVPLESGTYAFRLRTSDAFGAGGTDLAWVVVDDPKGNLVPVAVAELETKVSKIRQGRMVTLRGKDSIDGDPGAKLGHTWVQVSGPAVALLSTYGKNTRMKVPLAGDYTFELRVDDGIDRSPPVTVSFTAVQGKDGLADEEESDEGEQDD